MTSVLRIYDPEECDPAGVPLDWERCQACGDGGYHPDSPGMRCPVCAGHGSLKATALAELAKQRRGAKYSHDPNCPCLTHDGPCDCRRVLKPVRCAGCGHPMSEGTWEHPAGAWTPSVEYAATAEDSLRNGHEPVAFHYSPCDEGCRHGGPFRWREPDWIGRWAMVPEPESPPSDRANFLRCGRSVEASWRPVDVRTLGWPHDLRPEKLAVLCLRCSAAR